MKQMKVLGVSPNLNNQKVFTLAQKIILLFMFLGAINFVGRYYYCVYIAFLLFMAFEKGKIKPSVSLASLVLLSLFILLFDDSWGGITGMIKPFTYPVCFIMGYNLLNVRNNVTIESKEKAVVKIIFLVAIANFIHFALNMVTNFGSLSRNTVDFWTKSVLSATSQMSLACLAIGISCAYLFSDSKFRYKVLSVIILMSILAYNLILAGRTLIVMIMVILAVSYIYYMIKSDDKSKKLKVFISAIAIFLLFAVCYGLDLFGIRTAVEQSNLYNRFFGEYSVINVGEDSRFDYKLAYISRMLSHPFGGNEIFAEVGTYAHDLFLDTYDRSGIFAFVAILVYIISSIVNVIKILRSSNTSFFIKQLIMCTYAVLYMEFLVEPILIGMPWLFATFCFIDGAVSKLITEISRAEKKTLKI